MVEIWSVLESKTISELREMIDHFDALKGKEEKLHHDEKIALDNLKFIDGYVGGLRKFYRKKVIKRIK